MAISEEVVEDHHLTFSFNLLIFAAGLNNFAIEARKRNHKWSGKA